MVQKTLLLLTAVTCTVNLRAAVRKTLMMREVVVRMVIKAEEAAAYHRKKKIRQTNFLFTWITPK